MRIGFIGTGGITTAIVTGLCTCDNVPESIWVSPRNSEKAAALKAAYPTVQVGEDNQDVVDRVDVVVLAVLPQQKADILSPLQFRENQLIIHLLAGTQVDAVRPLVAPAKEIVRAVPLPCCAIHVGPIALYSTEDTASQKGSDLFDPLGTVVKLEKESQLETLAIITALMAPYYTMVEQVVAWGEGQGIDRKDAAAYTAAMFGALSAIAESDEQGDIKTLVTECMTPGGLNELAMKVIDEKGGFAHVETALEAVRNR